MRVIRIGKAEAVALLSSVAIVCGAGLLPVTPVSAYQGVSQTVYRCKLQNGKVEVRDRPCENDSSVDKVYRSSKEIEEEKRKAEEEKRKAEQARQWDERRKREAENRFFADADFREILQRAAVPALRARLNDPDSLVVEGFSNKAICDSDDYVSKCKFLIQFRAKNKMGGYVREVNTAVAFISSRSASFSFYDYVDNDLK